ncbi:thioredoxin [Dictyocaulus viviparus]|uniref:Thioredoxin n=1 Tax=Dictyocaulus viviparus TaxID=29172 RepID=A0A0D8XR04_DICVI|nr:thioredoxin [Dictyocaulus viviparus]
MALRWFDEAKQIITIYHFLNCLLSIAFIFTKGISRICPWIFTTDDKCAIDNREHEILMFLAVIIAWKGRKATNWLHYINNVFLFSKLANIALFLRADMLVGTLYLMIVAVVTIVVPEPIYSGQENITYFQGPELFEELERDRKSFFIIQFYTTWSPDCRHISPVFAQLSERFALPNLRFGKLDVGRWPKEADRFRINAHPTSRQLPTICVFRDGKELKRRPLVSEKRRAIPFIFTQENCILDFDLLNIHKGCVERLSSNNKKEVHNDKKVL